MREGYAVTVTKWGEPILTIERECLSGAELSAEDERAVFEAGKHLCSFVGDPDAPINWGSDPNAIVEDDEPHIGRDYA